MAHTSSISYGEEYSNDFSGPLSVRFNSDDNDYPISIEGITSDGTDISLSITKEDALEIWNSIDDSTLTI